jgi:hypothetical protein
LELDEHSLSGSLSVPIGGGEFNGIGSGHKAEEGDDGKGFHGYLIRGGL